MHFASLVCPWSSKIQILFAIKSLNSLLTVSLIDIEWIISIKGQELKNVRCWCTNNRKTRRNGSCAKRIEYLYNNEFGRGFTFQLECVHGFKNQKTSKALDSLPSAVKKLLPLTSISSLSFNSSSIPLTCTVHHHHMSAKSSKHS